MKPPMKHTAYKVTTTRNSDGDYIASGTTALKCHFREINEILTDSNNQVIQSDAMMWFEPDVNVSEGNIIKIYGEHYRVERIVKARRLRGTSVLFIKVWLLKYGPIS